MTFVTMVRFKLNIRSWFNRYLVSLSVLVAIQTTIEVAIFGCRYFQSEVLLISQEHLEPSMNHSTGLAGKYLSDLDTWKLKLPLGGRFPPTKGSD